MNGMWFNGPDLLQLEEQLWPVEYGKADLKEVNEEKRKVEVTCAVAITELVVNSQEFSTWKRLLRVTAYVIRFRQNILSRSSHDKEKNQVNVGALNAEEIVHAEEYWIKNAQAGLSAGMSKGSSKSLSTFIDDKGIVRVGGCVDPAVVSYDGHMPLFCHMIIGYPCSSPAMHIKQDIQESQQPLPKSDESTG